MRKHRHGRGEMWMLLVCPFYRRVFRYWFGTCFTALTCELSDFNEVQYGEWGDCLSREKPLCGGARIASEFFKDGKYNCPPPC